MKGELLGYLEMEKIQTKVTLGFYFVLFRIWPIFNLACKDIFFLNGSSPPYAPEVYTEKQARQNYAWTSARHISQKEVFF